jgi:hypothetical protein
LQFSDSIALVELVICIFHVALGNARERGQFKSRTAPKAGTSVKDCAFENFVDQCELGALAQLRPTAAGLERSAAHPANEVGPSKNVGAQHRPCQITVEPAPGMEARRAETIELKEIKVRSDGLGSRQPDP